MHSCMHSGFTVFLIYLSIKLEILYFKGYSSRGWFYLKKLAQRVSQSVISLHLVSIVRNRAAHTFFVIAAPNN
jgi:hypothetical protein